jgi:hypothetical protein
MSSPDIGWWTKVLAGPGGDLRSVSSDEQYMVLPSFSDPRVVVDRDADQAVKDSIDRIVAARTKNSTARSLAGAASTLLWRRKAGWIVNAAASHETLREHLAKVLDTDLRISISVGPPRPNRKPVVRCYRDSGLFAVAKLGPDPHTAAMVENEARWLDVMAGSPLSGVITPPLLHSGAYGGSALLIMGALNLESDLGVEFDEVPLDIAREFAEQHAEQLPLVESEWWHGLPIRMDTSLLDSVKAQLHQAPGLRAFDSIETAAWHGDWSPWNMGRSTNGKLCIWDWERARVGVPTGFDILHLHFQYGDGIDGADGYLLRLGVPESSLSFLKRLYFFELCARHCEANALDTEHHRRVLDGLDVLAP